MTRRTVAGVPVTPRVVLGLVAVFAVAAVLVSVLRHDPQPPGPHVAPVVPGAVRGEPGSAGRSAEAAVAAAVEYATLFARVFPAPPSTARAVVAEAASEAYRPALLAAVDRDLLPLQRRAAALPGQTVYRQAVLATRVDWVDAPGGRARVAVWLLSMVGQAGQQANPLASFGTVVLELRWERSWRLDGVTESAGPTPLLDGSPQLVDEVAAALRGFADWRPA